MRPCNIANPDFTSSVVCSCVTLIHSLVNSIECFHFCTSHSILLTELMSGAEKRSGAKSQKWVHQKPTNQLSIRFGRDIDWNENGERTATNSVRFSKKYDRNILKKRIFGVLTICIWNLLLKL